MESVAQWLDDLDDLVCAVRLLGERIRNSVIRLLVAIGCIAIQAAFVTLALVHPPVALALATILFVSLLYRIVTGLHLPLEIA